MGRSQEDIVRIEVTKIEGLYEAELSEAPETDGQGQGKDSVEAWKAES